MVLQTVFILWLSNLSLLRSSAQASISGPGKASEEVTTALTADTEVYNRLQYSLVRISSISDNTGSSPKQLSTVLQLQEGEGSFHKEAPHREAQEESVGSGFFVDLASYVQNLDSSDEYTIITNAHVVNNAKTVSVQLPPLGQQLFNATVPMICFDFDLAIVKIANSSKVREALEKTQATVQRIKLQEKNVRMGLRVAALGFPLGSQWLKVSEGLIAGVEAVSNGMVFQSSAPISPGNSGGPLLKYRQQGGQEVLDTAVGVNFATASSSGAQNLNYVVPAFRVAQLLKKYDKLRVSLPAADSRRVLDAMGTGTKAHMNLRLPPIGVVYTKSTPAQMNKSGCSTGIQIDRIGHYSMFRWADPAIPEGSFLVKVDGVDIDTFGMGNGGEYMQQIVDFQDLLTFRLDEGSVGVTICLQGKLSTHTLNLSWNSTRYEPGIRLVQEPAYDKSGLDIEVFAGAILVQLSQNMVQAAVQQYPKTSLARFLMVENQIQPKVVIASCQSGSSCSDVLMGGMIVERINGCRVNTMAEVRKCFEPAGSTWELETDRGVVFVADFEQELEALASGSQGVTKAVRDALLKAALREQRRAAEAANGTDEAANGTDEAANGTDEGERREEGEQDQQKAANGTDEAMAPGHDEQEQNEATNATEQRERQASSLDKKVAELEKEKEQLDILIQKVKGKARHATGRASSMQGRRNRLGIPGDGQPQPLATDEEEAEEEPVAAKGRFVAPVGRKSLLRAEVSADGHEALS
eukprot:TRINITY_DN925_c0_g1_i2.p1 TRINITY_DN925_c0_g1~~TRINITY_DN925_c0_g1_i2.p1  ORF type:complete len:751 (-),score=169.44 TRINITY_DN925_c0_g1_i2:28-2280(-)